MQAQTSYQPPSVSKEASMTLRKQQCALCYQLKLWEAIDKKNKEHLKILKQTLLCWEVYLVDKSGSKNWLHKSLWKAEKIDDPLWPNISTSTSLLQNTILKMKYRMCGTVHKYYIPLLCTLLRLPGRQQHCRWTLSAGEGAHISSLVPSHSRSQRGQANLELPQGCLSLKVIDTCFIHEPHLLENGQV